MQQSLQALQHSLQQPFLWLFFVEKTNEMAKEGTKTKTFVLLDGSVTTYGFRVLADGVDTTQFERNPVMFYNHNDYSLPIGTWSNVRKENGRILADANFDYADTDKDVQRIIGKIERGIIKMCSVGLRDPEVSTDDSYKTEGQTLPTVVKSRLREVSIVSIGGNHNALRLYDKEDTEIDLSNDIRLSDFIKPYKNQFKMNEEILKLLNLSDKADNNAVMTAVIALKDSNKTLTDEKAALQAKINELNLADKTSKKNQFVVNVDAAVKSGRLNASGKDSLLELYDAKPESAEKFLDSIPAVQSVTQAINTASQGNTTELADLLAKSWEELDKAGRLITLKDKYPDAYKDKFKEKFGVEPTIN